MDDRTRTLGFIAFAGVFALSAFTLAILLIATDSPATTRAAATGHVSRDDDYQPRPRPTYRFVPPIPTAREEEPPDLPPDRSEPVPSSVSEALKVAIVDAQRKADEEARAEEERRRSADEATRRKAEELARAKAEEEKKEDALGAKTLLQPANFQVGAVGRPYYVVGKVLQVFDNKRMLVGIADARTNDGRYTTWILLTCPTGSLIDGRLLHGAWRDVLGPKGYLAVTGTVKVRAGGSERVVLAVEARKRP